MDEEARPPSPIWAEDDQIRCPRCGQVLEFRREERPDGYLWFWVCPGRLLAVPTCDYRRVI